MKISEINLYQGLKEFIEGFRIRIVSLLKEKFGNKWPEQFRNSLSVDQKRSWDATIKKGVSPEETIDFQYLRPFAIVHKDLFRPQFGKKVYNLPTWFDEIAIVRNPFSHFTVRYLKQDEIDKAWINMIAITEALQLTYLKDNLILLRKRRKLTEEDIKNIENEIYQDQQIDEDYDDDIVISKKGDKNNLASNKLNETEETIIPKSERTIQLENELREVELILKEKRSEAIKLGFKEEDIDELINKGTEDIQEFVNSRKSVKVSAPQVTPATEQSKSAKTKPIEENEFKVQPTPNFILIKEDVLIKEDELIKKDEGKNNPHIPSKYLTHGFGMNYNLTEWVEVIASGYKVVFDKKIVFDLRNHRVYEQYFLGSRRTINYKGIINTFLEEKANFFSTPRSAHTLEKTNKPLIFLKFSLSQSKLDAPKYKMLFEIWNGEEGHKFSVIIRKGKKFNRFQIKNIYLLYAYLASSICNIDVLKLIDEPYLREIERNKHQSIFIQVTSQDFQSK